MIAKDGGDLERRQQVPGQRRGGSRPGARFRQLRPRSSASCIPAGTACWTRRRSARIRTGGSGGAARRVGTSGARPLPIASGGAAAALAAQSNDDPRTRPCRRAGRSRWHGPSSRRSSTRTSIRPPIPPPISSSRPPPCLVEIDRAGGNARPFPTCKAEQRGEDLAGVSPHDRTIENKCGAVPAEAGAEHDALVGVG